MLPFNALTSTSSSRESSPSGLISWGSSEATSLKGGSTAAMAATSGGTLIQDLLLGPLILQYNEVLAQLPFEGFIHLFAVSRPKINAVANSVKGKGFENMQNYDKNCALIYLQKLTKCTTKALARPEL